MTNIIGESIYSITIWNIVNHLSKHNFLLLDFKGRRFSDHVNRNRRDLILARWGLRYIPAEFLHHGETKTP